MLEHVSLNNERFFPGRHNFFHWRLFFPKAHVNASEFLTNPSNLNCLNEHVKYNLHRFYDYVRSFVIYLLLKTPKIIMEWKYRQKSMYLAFVLILLTSLFFKTCLQRYYFHITSYYFDPSLFFMLCLNLN